MAREAKRSLLTFIVIYILWIAYGGNLDQGRH